jgi:hypothetical protein
MAGSALAKFTAPKRASAIENIFMLIILIVLLVLSAGVAAYQDQDRDQEQEHEFDRVVTRSNETCHPKASR